MDLGEQLEQERIKVDGEEGDAGAAPAPYVASALFLLRLHAAHEGHLQPRHQRLVRLPLHVLHPPVAVLRHNVVVQLGDQLLHVGAHRLLVLRRHTHVARALQQLPVLRHALTEPPCPQRRARVLRLVPAQRRSVSPGLELLLDALHGAAEEVVHAHGVAVSALLDGGPLGQLVEGLQQLHALAHGGALLRGAVEDLGGVHLQLLDAVGEALQVAMPRARVHVQHVVARHPQLLDQGLKLPLNVQQRVANDFPARAAEGGHLLVLLPHDEGTARKLALALADLEQPPAPLHKRVDLREEAGFVNVPPPAGVRCRRVDLRPHHQRFVAPAGAARDGVLQHSDRGRHVVAVHVVKVDGSAAAPDDAVIDLANEARNLVALVEPGVHRNKADALEDGGKEGGNVRRGRRLQLLARAGQNGEEAQVVGGLHAAVLDHVGQLQVGGEVGRLCRLQRGDDLLHLGQA